MSSQTNNGCIKRIRYYKGQVLTAKDFQDQQAYHRDKLQRHVKRFPFGVLQGLDVKFENDVFIIEAGSAVDSSGREIMVGVGGLTVPRTSFDPSKSYLSVIFTEKDSCDEQSVCEGPKKYNRTCEQAGYRWDNTPDPTGNRITLAKVEESTDEEEPYIFRTDFDDQGRRIRLDAKLVDEQNIIFRDINGHDHTGEGKGTPIPTDGIENQAITNAKITDGAVTTLKIATGAVTQDKLANNSVIPDKLNDDAVESQKIADADNLPDSTDPTGVNQKTTEGKGIKTPHIQDRAISAIKIADADNEEDPNDPSGFNQKTDEGYGVKTGHIQNGAVTQEKLSGSIQTRPSGPAGGDLAGEFPNPSIGNVAITNQKLANGAVSTEKIESNDDSKKIQLVNLSNAVRNQLVPSPTHNHTGGSAGPRLNHSDLNLGTATNPHHTTAVDIDTEGGTNQIVAQINAGTGVISKERIEPFVGAAGWVRLPFLPKKYSTGVEFQHFVIHSISGSGGAQGNMDIPVPPGATRIKRFRIAGTGNEGTVNVQLFRGGTNTSQLILFDSITGAPFDEIYTIEQNINSESENIGVYVAASAASDILFIAAEFE